MYQNSTESILRVDELTGLSQDQRRRFTELYPVGQIDLVSTESLPKGARTCFMSLSRRFVDGETGERLVNLPNVCCFRVDQIDGLISFGMWRKSFVALGRNPPETAIYIQNYGDDGQLVGKVNVELRDYCHLRDHPMLVYVETSPSFRRRGLATRWTIQANAISRVFWGKTPLCSSGHYITLDHDAGVKPMQRVWKGLVERGLADPFGGTNFPSYIFRRDIGRDGIEEVLKKLLF